MKLVMRFEGGQSRYGTDGVNYLMPDWNESDAEAVAWCEETLDESSAELYEETVVTEEDDEWAGYEEMVDALSEKLSKAGFPMERMKWPCELGGDLK